MRAPPCSAPTLIRLPTGRRELREEPLVRLGHRRRRDPGFDEGATVATELGEFEEVKAVLGDALRAAAEAGDERIAHHARLVQLYAQLYSGETDGGSDWSSEVATATEEAIPIFEATGYDRGLTFAWRMRVGMYGAAQQAAAIQEAIEPASVIPSSRI